MAKTKPKTEAEELDEAIDQVIDTDAQFKSVVASEPGPEMSAESEKEFNAKMFNVRTPIQLSIGGRLFPPGVHKVDRGTMEMISEMVNKKRNADLAVFAGKSHLIERLADRSLRITEVDQIDFKK